LVGIGFLLALLGTPDENGKNRNKRLGFLMAFSFCTGLGLGPLLDIVNLVNSSIIGTAFFGTSLIFGCFSLSALLAPRGRWIYLGGPLLSLLSMMSFMAITNIFFRSQMMFQAQIYIGFAVMCGFILFDTQMIVEKRRMGDTDVVTHSLDLFIDFVSVFRYLLVILTQKEQNKKRR
jgi:FtsH-binding integral membrane protein